VKNISGIEQFRCSHESINARGCLVTTRRRLDAGSRGKKNGKPPADVAICCGVYAACFALAALYTAQPLLFERLSDFGGRALAKFARGRHFLNPVIPSDRHWAPLPVKNISGIEQFRCSHESINARGCLVTTRRRLDAGSRGKKNGKPPADVAICCGVYAACFALAALYTAQPLLFERLSDFGGRALAKFARGRHFLNPVIPSDRHWAPLP
jgi:hypothetical protein